ncbi:MAG TPA: cysteine dioxygenase family protein [Propionibacteriaceae bacterium]|nr:cysteine dioxygenase family protein [Propionibacteriaceae bacterium]
MTTARPTSSNRPRADLAQIASTLAADTKRWQPLVNYDPVSRYYARLAVETEYEAWLLTWLPGQGTDWHDHGGSAGAFRVLAGTLTERHATIRRDGVVSAQPGQRALSAGALRPFGSRHVHRVTNDGLTPAVSLHVYAPALTEMNTYRPQGQVLELVSAQLVGVNW